MAAKKSFCDNISSPDNFQYLYGVDQSCRQGKLESECAGSYRTYPNLTILDLPEVDGTIQRTQTFPQPRHEKKRQACECEWLALGQPSTLSPHIENSIVRFTTMLTEPILSHESEYPFPVVPTVLKLAGQGTSDSADSRARLVLYEPAHSGIELTL
ncbi:hypothetical protein M8J77_009680 [Diaphorina citri]|nr:hypothetical protein M8J77_009680 [Diaphorina citri]